MSAKKANRFFLYLLLAVIALIFVVPIFYSLFNSLKSQQEILSVNMTFFPHRPILDNYAYVFARGGKYLNYYRTSVVITVLGVVITVICSAMAGYAFAKLPFKGSGVIMAFILFVVTFPLAALLIPIYIMEYNLGLLNTAWGLIFPNVMNVLPFSVFIMRGVFKAIPKEMEESAEMDGCSVFQTWLNIVLPIARNGLVIVTVFSFYSIWGEYTMGKTLATEDSAMPISVALTMLKGDSWNFGVLGAVITMTIIPPIVVFLIFQKQLVEGMVQGAVKG
jgi:ABC-type glycerol-3-phosphate transport system permease component